MRIGTMFLGEVENLQEESIQTKFFVLGIPVVPIESYYVLSDTGGSVQGFRIPTHGISVLAGYTRLLSFMGAFVGGIFAYIELDSYDPSYDLAIAAMVSAAIWLASLFLLGRLSKTEKQRRLMLKAMAGMGAPPEILPTDVRDDIVATLLKRWREVHPDTNWRTYLQSGAASTTELLLLYTLARYELEPDLAAFAEVGLGSA